MMQPNQAANELTEDQVLNFLVNTLNKEIEGEKVTSKYKGPVNPDE